jgi:hypothetical protein
LDGFGIFGVVKEVGVDDAGKWSMSDVHLRVLQSTKTPTLTSFFLFPLSGLAEFHSQFFPYPLYKDDE